MRSGTVPKWADVLGSGSSPFTKSNGSQTMSAAGTLNFSFSPTGTGTMTWRVYKNGTPTTSPASLAVNNGDLVWFDFTQTGISGTERSGTFTVSGLYSATFAVDLAIP
jgi:hypothetical protein